MVKDVYLVLGVDPHGGWQLMGAFNTDSKARDYISLMVKGYPEIGVGRDYIIREVAGHKHSGYLTGRLKDNPDLPASREWELAEKIVKALEVDLMARPTLTSPSRGRFDFVKTVEAILVRKHSNEDTKV